MELSGDKKNTPKALVILGAGGMGREALWVAIRMTAASSGERWKVIGFVDDGTNFHGDSIDGLQVLGTRDEFFRNYVGQKIFFHCAIGNNHLRKKVAEEFTANGFVPATLIDPLTVISGRATVGEGSFVGAWVYVGPQAVIGRHVLVNVASTIGHDVRLGDYAQICPGARISGDVIVGSGALVGSNAVVTPGIKVGEWSSLAAGSVAAREVRRGGSAMGVPAKLVAPAGNI